MSLNVEENQIVFTVTDDSQVVVSVTTNIIEITVDENSTDLNAIHKNISGEINSLTLKETPHINDLVIIEDSQDSNKKKKAKISSIGSSSGVSSVNGQTGAVTLTIPDELSDLTEDSTHRVVTDAEKSTWNAKQSAIGYTPENQANKVNSAINNSSTEYPTSGLVRTALQSKADLVDGLVPSNQLPSYVDDVLEFTNLASFPVTGAVDKIYVAKDTNIIYRWSGSAYVEISSSLALGETSATAYRGDRGKTAYDHSQTTGNPHGSTTADISDSNDKRYVTEAEKTKLANTSGTNTGDQDIPETLADFTDVDLTGLTDGDLLIRTGGQWVRANKDDLISGQDNVSYAYTHANIYGENPHGMDLSTLLDVLVTSVQDGQILQFNASEGKFINVTLNKDLIGLGNVDNTSDVDKPISSATQTALDGKENSLGFTPEDSANKDQNNGYAGLDGSGKINPSQLPAIAISSTFVVANQSEMLLLTAETGDIAIRNDLGKTFILQGTDPTELTDWIELATPTDAVTSVFGRTGVVTAQSGDYDTGEVTEVTDKKYVTDAEKTKLSNLSGTNTGDQDLSGYFNKSVDDLDDLTDGTVNKGYTSTEKGKLANIESNADVTDAGNVGSSIHGASAKTTPVDADTMPLIDSTDSNALKKVTWSNIKATLKTYLDTLYQVLNSNLTTIAGLTATTDNFIVSVSSAWASRTPAQVKTTLSLNNVDNTSDSTKNSATATLTNKRITPRVGTDTSSATPTINTDNVDMFTITALATAITSMTTNLSGTPTEGQKLVIRIKDNGTARAITWGASFRASSDLALPTTTTLSKTLYCGFIWNATDSKWDLIAKLDNF